MKRFELSLEIIDQEYLDSLIVALVRQGYEVYYNKEENVLCFTVMEEDLIEMRG